MSIRNRRRETEVFSLAFLDCICCGFGAMLLVFILTVVDKKTVDKDTVADVDARLKAAMAKTTQTKEDLERLARSLAAAQLELEDQNAKNNQDQLKLTARQRELLLIQQETGALKDALASLLGEKKALPTEAAPTLPMPQVDRSQYLTGVRFEGDYVLFLVRASGSMLDENVDDASARLEDPDFKKRTAPKWKRVVNSLEWMIATLDPDTHFQVLLFSDETLPLLPGRRDAWYTRRDKDALHEIVTRIEEVVPHGSANLERAFADIRAGARRPDDIVLFTDGLPTTSDSRPASGFVDETQRVQFFRVAIQALPTHVPVSTILFPFAGDPRAPGLYWLLAHETRGALVSPAKDWPEK